MKEITIRLKPLVHKHIKAGNKCYPKTIREHPFNLKGGVGVWFFGEFFFLSANLIEKQILSMKWPEKNIPVGTLCLKQYYFCRKKIMSQQLVAKKNSAALRSEKKYFYSEKTHSPSL